MDPKPLRLGDTLHSIPDTFCDQVARHGQRNAVEGSGDTLTFDALNRFSNQIAHAVLSHLGEASQPVAVLMGNEGATVAALLGVLKAGKFFVVLDASHPDSHLQYILQDCGTKLILCNEQTAARARQLASTDTLILTIDQHETSWPTSNPKITISLEDNAYLVYTSGTTGRPKGVIQSHRSVIHSTMRFTTFCDVTHEDRFSLTYSFGYAATITDLFGSLLSGSALCLNNLYEKGVGSLVAWLNAERISCFFVVPSTFRALTRQLEPTYKFTTVRLLFFGGETSRQSDFETFKQHFSSTCVLKNGFGVTEMVNVVKWFVPRTFVSPNGIVPIGFPMPGVDILLVDESNKEVADGQIGEIVVKSEYLSPGYWRQPDLTRQKFYSDPAGGLVRCYKTGDLGQKMPDGCLMHLGRIDSQVKIRGVRVEVAGVEDAIQCLPGVQEVCVVVQSLPNGSNRLIAFVVTTQDTASTLRKRLEQSVPSHMVPAVFVLLDALPLTPNGKIDRQALPSTKNVRSALLGEFVAPVTGFEARVVAVWESVLDITPIGIKDKFLDLGGDSLSAVTIISQVERLFGQPLDQSLLLSAETPERMAAVIAGTVARHSGAVVVPLKPTGTRPPLFLCGITLNLAGYVSLLAHLPEDQPAYGIDFVVNAENSLEIPSVAEVIRASVAAVRAFYPQGPVNLVGYSAGGVWAAAIARRLLAEGETVGLLALIDTFVPGSLSTAPLPFWQRMSNHLKTVFELTSEQKSRYILERLTGLLDRFLSPINARFADLRRGRSLTRRLRAEAKIRTAIWAEMIKTHTHEPYSGTITYFRATEQKHLVNREPQAPWQDIALGGWRQFDIPGHHHTFMSQRSGSAAMVAAILCECLQPNQRQTNQQQPNRT